MKKKLLKSKTSKSHTWAPLMLFVSQEFTFFQANPLTGPISAFSAREFSASF
jgi:hypothetical protein